MEEVPSACTSAPRPPPAECGLYGKGRKFGSRIEREGCTPCAIAGASRSSLRITWPPAAGGCVLAGEPGLDCSGCCGAVTMWSCRLSGRRLCPLPPFCLSIEMIDRFLHPAGRWSSREAKSTNPEALSGGMSQENPREGSQYARRPIRR
ncbi:hypothetical protein GLOTRDRAFT_111334 [Gloeophyllum trabeum ATCC 11539]|uniref:Uncharacterized protein n=1 Tax=Gloeophyllum trabeum (strain ATCC 11539 / FP-39264 / Madison 617) TaxID=670483 RepID=S7Q501_GLOTA|nr:uncharacterized protein GLOTRDRAFT_111334 [Gloeophyllum trabeum ATCC 11539]EPQ54598.1 hypothetical protein GLOTRDRAFT_111334 [Gloeophyllum trabeum ATCC 11539]